MKNLTSRNELIMVYHFMFAVRTSPTSLQRRRLDQYYHQYPHHRQHHPHYRYRLQTNLEPLSLYLPNPRVSNINIFLEYRWTWELNYPV